MEASAKTTENRRLDFSVEHHIKEIAQNGFSIAEGVIPLSFCEEIIEDIKRLEGNGPPALRPNLFTGFETLRYFDLLNKGEIWERVAVFDPVTQVIRGVLGQDALLSTMGTAVIGPGESPQRIHCDDGLYGIKRPHKNLVCNTMWALSDFTVENGATQLVKGSHRWDHYPDDNLTREQRTKIDPTGADQSFATERAIMPKGSICFVVGTCFHGGGANTTDERRWALTINYCAGSQRQQENLMLAHTREKLATFNPELQKLLGLVPSSFGVGHINAGDPRQILA